jgi:transposase-like protein
MNESTNSCSPRRRFGDDQKAAIVRRHLADKVPVSDLADEYSIQPILIYLWIKQALDQAERAFQQASGGKRRRAIEDVNDRRMMQSR